MKALAPEFYDRPVLEVAHDLIGCTVEHKGTAGVIVETEAYHESEPACHAFVGLTPRTRPLFGPPGRAYVYRSYGIHALFNAVCEVEGVGAAVLIRALEPTVGLAEMRLRRWGDAREEPIGGRGRLRDEDLCSGPGKLSQALGISLAENDSDLATGPIRIGPRAGKWLEPKLLDGQRIGITRAVELRWRFAAAANRNVSRPWPPATSTL